MDRQKMASSVSGGIFLIGLGVLALTHWWWPGIMLAVGLAAGAELAFRGKYLQALGTLALFAVIPLIIESNIPWGLVLPWVLISLGAVVLVKVLLLRE